jgi:hypothetical protein
MRKPGSACTNYLYLQEGAAPDDGKALGEIHQVNTFAVFWGLILFAFSLA